MVIHAKFKKKFLFFSHNPIKIGKKITYKEWVKLQIR